MTSALLFEVSEKWEFYKNWIRSNPQLVSDSESVLKWCSYLLSGYVHNSAVLSELIFSAANLITFIHDRILAGSSTLSGRQYGYLENLLTVIEHVEVFLEIAALHFGGVTAKWAVIVAIQVLKTVMRLALLSRDGAMLVRPLIPGLDRSLLTQPPPQPAPPASTEPGAVRLPRSGRVLRTVAGAPPPHCPRDWAPPSQSPNMVTTMLKGKRCVGEILYLSQPLVHLAVMGVTGSRSWSPFLTSLAMDTSSLVLHGDLDSLTQEERSELVRRRLALLAYILRSPLYDTRSKAVIVSVLQFSQNNIPLVGTVSKALLKYLHEYQLMYFYTWGK